MQTQSDDIKAITEAFLKAQAALVPATKASENPFFHSKYADLESVWNACRDALHANDIAVVQGAHSIDGKPHMETKLIHSSGQWLTSFWELVPTKPDPQAMGSAISYMRRYSLAAMVGVLTEDDDGNAASASKAKGKAETKTDTPSFWDRESYALPTTAKGQPDWVAWDKAILAAIGKCPDLERLTKLQIDNADSLKEYGQKFAVAEKAIMQTFATRMGDLSQGQIE